MSHSPSENSPPGTPFLERDHAGPSPLFQADKDRARAKEDGSDLDREETRAGAIGKSGHGSNPAELPADELCRHIVENHHEFLRSELPRLHAMADCVARVHGLHTPSLIELFGVFYEMAEELMGHLAKEEGVVFPVIMSLSRGEKSEVPLETPLKVVLREHDEINAAMERLRELTNDFKPPTDACNTYRALFAGLQELEEDLRKHLDLENSVLLPAVRKILASQC